MRPFARGRKLARGYEVIEHLARSNDYDVYDVWSHERACRCAVKLLRPDRRDQDRAIRGLRHEGELLQRLTHPHLVRGYETLDEPLVAVVMQMLGGETVSHLVHTRPEGLNAVEVGYLGVHLCSAIGYLHGEGILHLDLKTSNVIAEAGSAIVIDLSLARAPGRMRAGIGTNCYMAPEQARGGHVDAAADVWGIAGILYACATGLRLFAERADRRSEYPSLEGPVKPVGRDSRLPAEMAATIDAALSADPLARPSVDELGAVCERSAEMTADERRFAHRANGRRR